MIKNLILLNNSVNFKSEPFLRQEFNFIQKENLSIFFNSSETEGSWVNLTPSQSLIQVDKQNLQLRIFIKHNWKLILNAWLLAFIKSPMRFNYLKNYKKYFNIWMGWLQEAKAWEEILKQFDPKDTIIYTYWYEQQANALTVLRAQGKLPFKWVSRAHGYDVDKRQRVENLIPFRHWMLKHAPDDLVSISNFGANVFKNDYSAAVKIAKLGTPDLGLGAEPIENNALSLVSISNIIPLKRVHLIIDILSKTKSSITWTHYGDGPIAEVLNWNNLPENIQLIRKGHITHERLLEELKTTPFDLMLHFSEFEGIPVSIMECMSLGIPVMACDTGGVAEIVNDENGWLLPVNLDFVQVAKTIDYLAENRGLLQSKRDLARQTWEKEYQAKVNFPSFIQTYLMHPNN